jgi:hypothetical protein
MVDLFTGISESTLKNLQDKSVEKRKQAAAELQEIIETLMSRNQFDKIKSEIDMFSKMVYSE